MSATQVSDYIKEARRDRVPHGAVRKKCLGWDDSFDRAEQVAEDASQESYSRAIIQEIHEPGFFKDASHLRGWVTTTAVRYAIDQYRKSVREGSPIDEVQVADPKPAHDGQTVVGACLADLSEVEQAILWLDYAGRTLDEISREVGEQFPAALRGRNETTPPKAVPSQNALRLRVMRLRDAAIGRLEECLKENGVDPYGRRRRARPDAGRHGDPAAGPVVDRVSNPWVKPMNEGRPSEGDRG